MQPIPLDEIERWVARFWHLNEDKLIHLVLALDAAHRQWVAERTAKDSDDQVRPS